MALTHKRLIKTQIPNAAGQLGTTVPTGKTWYLKEVWLYNTNTTVENVVLYGGGTAASDALYSISLDASEAYAVPMEYPWILNAGEALFGSTTTSAKVNIVVNGAEA